MRLWQVQTGVELTITTKLFKKEYKENQWFTHSSKFIYANTKEEAIEKYKRIFYTKLESSYTKKVLRYFEMIAETKSKDFDFYLPFYKHIDSAKESIICLDDEVNVSYTTLRNKMTCSDFRDWLYNL